MQRTRTACRNALADGVRRYLTRARDVLGAFLAAQRTKHSARVITPASKTERVPTGLQGPVFGAASRPCARCKSGERQSLKGTHMTSYKRVGFENWAIRPEPKLSDLAQALPDFDPRFKARVRRALRLERNSLFGRKNATVKPR